MDLALSCSEFEDYGEFNDTVNTGWDGGIFFCHAKYENDDRVSLL